MGIFANCWTTVRDVTFSLPCSAVLSDQKLLAPARSQSALLSVSSTTDYITCRLQDAAPHPAECVVNISDRQTHTSAVCHTQK